LPPERILLGRQWTKASFAQKRFESTGQAATNAHEVSFAADVRPQTR
jgi:hypothetical protein